MNILVLKDFKSISAGEYLHYTVGEVLKIETEVKTPAYMCFTVKKDNKYCNIYKGRIDCGEIAILDLDNEIM